MLTTPQSPSRTNMPRARILPCTYYEHAVIGQHALDSLVITEGMISAGLSRSSFLLSQMELATTLDISVRAVAKNLGHPVRRWCQTFSRVPGFCWTKLLAPDWLVPTVCVLGAYPHSKDVAALSAWFREDSAIASFSLTPGGPQKRTKVAHVTGAPAHPHPPVR